MITQDRERVAEALQTILEVLMAPPEDPNQLLTYQEAADILRVDYSEVAKRVRRGEIPVVALGAKCKRIRLGDVRSHIRSHTKRVPQPGATMRTIRSLPDAVAEKGR